MCAKTNTDTFEKKLERHMVKDIEMNVVMRYMVLIKKVG